MIKKEPADRGILWNRITVAIVATLICISNTANAETTFTGLSDRGIPRATKLYEDESGTYYGAFLTGARRYKPNQPLKQQFFYVFAVRKTQPDGKIFDVVPLRTEGKYKSEGDGFALSASELDRIRTHIIPAIKEKIPNYRVGLANANFPIRYYVEGLHLDRTGMPGDANDTAENVIFEVWLFEQNGQYQTEYQKDGFPGILADQFPTTVADVRDRFTLTESATTDAVATNTSVISVFETEIAVWRDNRLAREVARLEKSRNPGFVYKGQDFWENYPNFDDVRDILHGNFEYIDHPSHLAQAYINYVQQYDEVCSAFLPKKRVVRTVTPLKRDAFGNWSQDGEPSETNIESRFADQFDRMYALVQMETTADMFEQAANSILQGDLFLTGVWKMVAEDYIDSQVLAKFLRSESCESPTVKQLADNLHAVAVGTAPVQHSRRGYPHAEKYSTAVQQADAERSLVQRLNLFTRAKSKSFGYPLIDAEVSPYRTGALANDGYDQVKELFTLGEEFSRVMQPVLTCFYGPIGRYDNGRWKFERRHFWYDSSPDGLSAYLNAATKPGDVHPGLSHALKRCPPHTAAANEVTGPIPDRWHNAVFTYYRPTLNFKQ